ncbi:hypothetical protein NZK33_04700 [Cyanobium sp. FGCU-6]|nr:hypothetical protein [Cyanobium sp. FGCU6]
MPVIVPSHARFAVSFLRQQPAGWSSLTPWGEAITTAGSEGFVELKAWRTTCLVDGQRRTVSDGLADIGGGYYRLNPWYQGDLQARYPIQTINGAVRLPVSPERVSHWWLTRRPSISGASQCEITAEVRLSPGVLVSIGGDYWINPTAPYAGDMVNNRYMGRSAWHDHIGGDQVIVFR